MKYEEFNKYALEWRNIEDPCDECSGSGITSYSDTSTYFGGIGGQMITNAVCNKCWGSGDKTKTWPSHLHYYQLVKKDRK